MKPGEGGPPPFLIVQAEVKRPQGACDRQHEREVDQGVSHPMAEVVARGEDQAGDPCGVRAERAAGQVPEKDQAARAGEGDRQARRNLVHAAR